MKKGKLTGGIFGIVLVVVLVVPMVGWLPVLAEKAEVSSATIYVPDNYLTIQAAVDAASSGDTIIVRAGIYQEHVTLYKSLILQTDEGAVIDGGGSLSTVTITAEGCTVSRFNITGSGSHPDQNAGIRIDSNSNNISGNTICGNKEGGILLHGSHNTLMSNSLSENEGFGLCIWGYENTIEGNTMSNNSEYGLYLGGWNNILRDNVMSGNGRNFRVSYGECNDVDTSNTVDGKPIYYLVGVRDELIDSDSNAGYVLAVDSENITIRDLALANNDNGVCLYGCYDCRVDNVTAQDSDYGIYLEECSYCTAQNCTVSGNVGGVHLDDSIGNLVTGNIIQGSDGTGIALDGSDGNFLTGNIVRDNHSGIRLWSSYDCRIEQNLVTRNEGNGISIDTGRGHLVYGNTISQNGGRGISIARWEPQGCDIHHNNFVDNGENAESPNSEEANSWDNGAEGNYWSDYEERYPDADEIDGTGIWDTPYEIPGDAGDKDNHPLTEPFETSIPNQPPDEPGNPFPADDAIGVSINADLSWIGGDPDPGDTVTYDIYFGTSWAPGVFRGTIGPYPATQSSITYDLPTSVPGATCYWQIVARDNHGITREGPVWEFTVEIEGIQLSLQAGWNMVSVPVMPTDKSTNAVFPGVAGIFTWNATSRSYYVPTVIEPEKGYWVAVTGNTTVTISGTPVETWTTDIKAGWNMIGSVNGTASITDPNDYPDGSVIPTPYWWDPVSKSYNLTTDVEPGKGYWLASANDCLLTL